MLQIELDKRGIIEVIDGRVRCGYISQRDIDASAEIDALGARYRTDRGVIDLGPRYGAYACVGGERLTWGAGSMAKSSGI